MKIAFPLAGVLALAATLAIVPNAFAVEEIVVTARKREEILTEIPVAITAWSIDEIQFSGAKNLEDLTLRTPGIQYHEQAGQIPGRYNTAVRFRGMDTNQSAPSQQLGTVFEDGVYVSTGVASIGFENIERVEIIKGPQSATFGRSTFAGAVNYVTRTPGFEYLGHVSADIAQDDTYDISLSHEGPIVDDKLAYRVTLRTYSTGGQYRSRADAGALGEEETNALQGVLFWKPQDNLTFKLVGAYSEDSDGPPSGIFMGGANSARGAGPNFHNCGLNPDYFCGKIPDVDANLLARSNTALNPFLIDHFTSNPVIDTFSGEARFKPSGLPSIDHVGLERESMRFSLTANWTPGSSFLAGHTLTSITGYNHMAANWIRDFDLTEAQNWLSQDPQKHDDFTQELRITSPQERRLRWSLGVNYFDVDFIQEGNGGNAVWAYDGELAFAGVPGPITFFSASIPEEGGTTKSVFGSLSIDILESLTLDLEARWQDDEVSSDSPETPEKDFEESFNSFLPRATLSFKPTDSTTLWFTYAEGNLPGFFNSDAVGLSESELAQIRDQIGEANLFNDEEELDSYEVGWKQQLMEDRVFFSLVGYWMDWKNQKTRQAVAIVRDTGEPFVANIQTNAGSSELWGIEFESTAVFNDRFSAQLSANYAEGEYQKFRCGFAPFLPEPKDCSGNTPPRYPDWSGSLSLIWQDQLTADWDYFARVDTTYFGKAYTDETNFAWTGEYWLANLRGGVQKDRLRIEGYVTNLFDDDNYTAVARWSDFSTADLFGFVANQGLAITPAQKRRFGLRMTFDF